MLFLSLISFVNAEEETLSEKLAKRAAAAATEAERVAPNSEAAQAAREAAQAAARAAQAEREAINEINEINARAVRPGDSGEGDRILQTQREAAQEAKDRAIVAATYANVAAQAAAQEAAREAEAREEEEAEAREEEEAEAREAELTIEEELRTRLELGMNSNTLGTTSNTNDINIGEYIERERESNNKIDWDTVCDQIRTQCLNLLLDNNNYLETLIRENRFEITLEDVEEMDTNSEFAEEKIQNALELYNSINDDEITLQELRERVRGRQEVTTIKFFDILHAVINPDPNTLDTLKLFGVEADYTRLPNWLSEDVSSSICLYKIDGYLDEAVSDDRGGLTQYERDFETDPRTGAPFDSNLVVRADVRGQRSQILPDGSIYLTYSYYLKAPDDSNLSYNINLVYLVNRNIAEPISLFEDPKVEKLINGTSNSHFETMRIQINDSENVDRNSFTLNFRAVKNISDPASTIVVDLTAPVVIIDSGDRISGRTRGRSRSSSDSNNGVRSDEDFYRDIWGTID